MSYTISSITPADILDVEKLYREVYADRPHLIKGKKELEWLFSDPHQEGTMPGFVARTPWHELVGVIGYSQNKYRFDGRELKGVIPISWMISPKHRGILGIQLLQKVMNEGDFGFAIQGSKEAQMSYQAVRLKYVGAAHIYTKVLRPLAYVRSGVPFSPANLLKAGYYLGRQKAPPAQSLVRLEPGSGSQGLNHAPVKHLAMVPEARRNQWLKDCPLVEMISFTLYYQDKEKGPAICYICETAGIRRGRIVHIPYLGNDTEAYQQAIALLEQELVERSCCSINALAMQSASRLALANQGYRTWKSTARNLYVRDPDKLLEGVALTQWYLTFYESDKGYRGI